MVAIEIFRDLWDFDRPGVDRRVVDHSARGFPDLQVLLAGIQSPDGPRSWGAEVENTEVSSYVFDPPLTLARLKTLESFARCI